MLSKAPTRLLAPLTAVATASIGCAHTHQPERKLYVILEDASGVDFSDGPGVGGAGAEAYCNEIQKQCFTKCWRRKPEHPSIKKHSGSHHEHCSDKCLKVFMNCLKEQEELERQEKKRELHFDNMDAARDWLREHTTQAPPGTHVLVAGVAFVVAIVAGALVLSPL
jgi:hypothetical protein